MRKTIASGIVAVLLLALFTVQAACVPSGALDLSDQPGREPSLPNEGEQAIENIVSC